MTWTFESKAPSDLSYIFYRKDFGSDELKAWEYFNTKKKYSYEHGGAGVLKLNGKPQSSFCYWALND